MPKVDKPKTKMGKALAKKGVRKTRRKPLWKGPQEDGITQSLLCGFLSCRERFRINVVEGLSSYDRFSAALEYGNMWHACEEEYARNSKHDNWIRALLDYCKKLAVRYPTSKTDIQHWYKVCKTQFVVYLDYWNNHKDQKNRTPLLQEESFAVRYELPSGRFVLLRGKWDGVDNIGKKQVWTWLQENKTKGSVDENELMSRLLFDIQTGIYLVALHTAAEEYDIDPKRIRGVRYNVIRRPLSGGWGTISKGKGTDEFYERLRDEYFTVEPDYFFMRFNSIVTQTDLDRFQREFLIPVLEDLCNWWEWIAVDPFDPFREGNEIHYRTPYGIYNPVAQGIPTELDHYLENGSKAGLTKVDTLFPELEDD